MNSICIVPTMKQTSRIQPKRMLGAKMLGTRNKYMSPLFLAIIIIFLALAPISAWAGMKEAKAAYDAKDYKTAFKEYLPLAEAGNAEAQDWVGEMYRYGQGKTVDYTKAVYWYKKAASQGFVYSIATLGYLVDTGDGGAFSQSFEKGNCLYRAASERGNRVAQWNLYYNLSDSFFTITEAKKWLQRSLNQGYPPALARQGALLTLNPLVFDKTEGLMYLVLAQKYGDDPEVDDVLEKVVGDNPSRKKQLEKAKAMAAKWKPVKEIPPTDLPPFVLESCLP